MLLLGDFDDRPVRAAVAEASAEDARDPNLILVCAETEPAEHQALARCREGVPLWILYPKGAGQQISEWVVRDPLRSRG